MDIPSPLMLKEIIGDSCTAVWLFKNICKISFKDIEKKGTTFSSETMASYNERRKIYAFAIFSDLL